MIRRESPIPSICGSTSSCFFCSAAFCVRSCHNEVLWRAGPWTHAAVWLMAAEVLRSVISKHVDPSELGGPSEKSFRLVRACAWWHCLVRAGRNSPVRRFTFFLFSHQAFPFPSRIPPPPRSYPTLVGFIGKQLRCLLY